jgi:hypothetical protein
MARFYGRWTYSKADNCYFTLMAGVIFLQAKATARGGIGATYQSVDFEQLNVKDAARIASIMKKLRRKYQASDIDGGNR